MNFFDCNRQLSVARNDKLRVLFGFAFKFIIDFIYRAVFLALNKARNDIRDYDLI